MKHALSAAATAKTSCLRNGQLEVVTDGVFEGWAGYGAGYEVDSIVRHSGRHSARCRNASASDQRGLSYHLELNQTTARPIMAECWSKAEGVSPGARGDYALYLDLEYADGTPLWGQVGQFEAGTHDWQQRAVTILPEKPVKSLTVYGLLRNRSGTAWFDDFRLWEVTETASQFDGVPVVARPSAATAARGAGLAAAPARREATTMTEITMETGDGLVLTLREPSGGIFVRDFAAKSDFVAPSGRLTKQPDGSVRYEARDEALKLAISATYRVVDDGPQAAGLRHIRIDGEVRDLSDKDRAISAYFAYPVTAVGWRWYDDQRTGRVIGAQGKYDNFVTSGAGANGLAVRYPLACIAGEDDAVAIAVPLDMPRLCRLGYDADSRELYAAFDLGLAPDTENFPSRATFSLVLYRPDPKWGFRSALQRYYDLFPQCFVKRNQKEGIWMPFSDIAAVKDFEDFGFQFKEGDNNVAFDAEHGIYSFVYVEPWSNWLDLPAEVERTPEQAISLLEKRAAEGSEKDQATLTSVMQDGQGAWCVRMEKQPWCDGAVLGVNPSPGVIGQRGYQTQYQHLWRDIEGAFARSPQLTGVYHDSFEMYMFPNQLNYRREHFRETTLPLVFDDQGRVCQYAMFSMVEFARDVAQRIWARGGLTFANGAPHSFPWSVAWLDVMGTEAAWAPSWGTFGQYRPESQRDLNYWRAMCYQRPYLMLLNTRFELWKPEWIERYMKRCAAYAVFPSMFSYNASEEPYWQRPDQYERDRPLFKKYIPVIKALSAAGWQPVTLAVSDNPKVYVERFGRPGGPLYFTVYNDSDESASAEIRFSEEVAPQMLTEVLSGEKVSVDKGAVHVDISPQDVKVFSAVRLSAPSRSGA